MVTVSQLISQNIGTRQSQSSPGTTEYYNTQTGQGFSDPNSLASYVNTLNPGLGANAQNVFGLVSQGSPAPAAVPTSIPASTVPQPLPATTAPVATQQPSPATVNATPYTQPATTQPITDINALIGQRPSQTNPNTTEFYNTKTGQGFSTPQDLSNFINSQGGSTTAQNVFDQLKQGFNNAKASGAAAPTTQGQAQSAINKYSPQITSQSPAGLSPIEQQLAQDPGYQQLLADRAEFASAANQQTSLLDFYNKSVKEAGIPALNEELINYKNVIDGTEDDIRNEVKAANGFATDSQVLALSGARNKSLIKNYNRLIDQKNAAMENINNMVSLSAQDRQFAMQAISQKLQIDQQLAEYRDKFVQNAKEGYYNIINAVGYTGLMEMMGNDPQAIDLTERTLGMQPGQLQNIASFIQRKSNLAKYADYNINSPFIVTAGGEVQNTQTGDAYSSPEDFAYRTGMTLDQANAKGLIKPLGATKAEQQQQFDNQLKLEGLAINKAQLGVSQYNAQTSRMNANIALANAQATQQNAQLKQVQDIIKENPGQWGKAATMIEATLGKKIETGSALDNMLHAAYATPSKDQIRQLASAQQNISQVTELLTDKGLDNAVGPNWAARGKKLSWDNMSGATQNFIASVDQIAKSLTKENLVNAKAQGATFGALGEKELALLEESATKINYWATTKDGKVVGYNASEKDFKDELNKINNFAKLDFVLKGGNPESVGMFKDGGVWATKNSDGTVTKFDELEGL